MKTTVCGSLVVCVPDTFADGLSPVKCRDLLGSGVTDQFSPWWLWREMQVLCLFIEPRLMRGRTWLPQCAILVESLRLHSGACLNCKITEMEMFPHGVGSGQNFDVWTGSFIGILTWCDLWGMALLWSLRHGSVPRVIIFVMGHWKFGQESLSARTPFVLSLGGEGSEKCRSFVQKAFRGR